MTLKRDHYTYRVTWSGDDDEYVGLCAEFPSLSWLAASPEAALSGIREVVTKVVKDMRKNREEVPELVFARKKKGDHKDRPYAIRIFLP